MADSGRFDSERAAEAARKRWRRVDEAPAPSMDVLAELDALTPALLADFRRQLVSGEGLGATERSQVLRLLVARAEVERDRADSQRPDLERLAAEDERSGEGFLDTLRRTATDASPMALRSVLRVLDGGYLAWMESNVKGLRALRRKVVAALADSDEGGGGVSDGR